MKKVVLYTKASCAYCELAKNLLREYHAPFQEIRVDLDDHLLNEMIQKSNRRTVPQIFIDDQSIGGFDDLAALAKSGKLDSLLN